jgi:dynein heavy chain
MAEISKAGYVLLKFVEAVLTYCAVYREVKPQKDRVAQLQRDYEKVSDNYKPPKLEILSHMQ